MNKETGAGESTNYTKRHTKDFKALFRDSWAPDQVQPGGPQPQTTRNSKIVKDLYLKLDNNQPIAPKGNTLGQQRHSVAAPYYSARSRQPVPAQDTQLASARTYTNLYKVKRMNISSQNISIRSSRHSVGAGSLRSLGVADNAAKDINYDKKILTDARELDENPLNSRASLTTTNQGSSSFATQPYQKSVRDKLTKKYGVGQSLDGKNLQEKREETMKAPVINIKTSSQIVGTREITKIEFQAPSKKLASGVMVPSKNSNQAVSSSIKIDSMDDSGAGSDNEDLYQVLHTAQLHNEFDDKGPDGSGNAYGGLIRLEHVRDVKGKRFKGVEGQEGQQQDQLINIETNQADIKQKLQIDDLDDRQESEPMRLTFQEQFLQPQLGIFKSPNALKLKSHKKTKSKSQFDNEDLKGHDQQIQGRLTVNVNDQNMYAGPIRMHDCNLRRPRIVRMKPRKKGDVNGIFGDQRNSVDSSIYPDVIDSQSCDQTEQLTNPSIDQTSEGRASAISFANPIAFQARLSRAESQGRDELVSSVSFAASKRRRPRPERCRRRRKMTASVEMEEDECCPVNPYLDQLQDLGEPKPLRKRKDQNLRYEKPKIFQQKEPVIKNTEDSQPKGLVIQFEEEIQKFHDQIRADIGNLYGNSQVFGLEGVDASEVIQQHHLPDNSDMRFGLSAQDDQNDQQDDQDLQTSPNLTMHKDTQNKLDSLTSEQLKKLVQSINQQLMKQIKGKKDEHAFGKFKDKLFGKDTDCHQVLSKNQLKEALLESKLKLSDSHIDAIMLFYQADENRLKDSKNISDQKGASSGQTTEELDYKKWIDSLREKLSGQRLQIVQQALKKINPLTKSQNLLVPSQIEIMKEVFNFVDHDNSNIVRRTHFIEELRLDADVKEFLHSPPCIRANLGREKGEQLLTVDEVLREVEADGRYQVEGQEQSREFVYSKWFITWDQFIDYFKDYREPEQRSIKYDLGKNPIIDTGINVSSLMNNDNSEDNNRQQKHKDIQNMNLENQDELMQNQNKAQTESNYQQVNNRQYDSMAIKQLSHLANSSIKQDKQDLIGKIDKLKPADIITISDSQLQFLRKVFDATPKNIEDVEAVDGKAFLVNLKQNPEFQALQNEVCRDPLNFSAIPQETFGEILQRMEREIGDLKQGIQENDPNEPDQEATDKNQSNSNSFKQQNLYWPQIVEFFTRRGKPAGDWNEERQLAEVYKQIVTDTEADGAEGDNFEVKSALSFGKKGDCGNDYRVNDDQNNDKHKENKSQIDFELFDSFYNIDSAKQSFSKDLDFDAWCDDLGLTDGTQEGTFSRCQFLEHYTDISTSLATDKDFTDLVASQWLLKTQEVPQEEIDLLVAAIKEKIKEKAKEEKGQEIIELEQQQPEKKRRVYQLYNPFKNNNSQQMANNENEKDQKEPDLEAQQAVLGLLLASLDYFNEQKTTEGILKQLLEKLELQAPDAIVQVLISQSDENIDGVTLHDEFNDFIFKKEKQAESGLNTNQSNDSGCRLWLDSVPNFVVFHKRGNPLCLQMREEWVKLAETCRQRGMQVNIASVLVDDNEECVSHARVNEFPTIRLYEGPIEEIGTLRDPLEEDQEKAENNNKDAISSQISTEQAGHFQEQPDIENQNAEKQQIQSDPENKNVHFTLAKFKDPEIEKTEKISTSQDLEQNSDHYNSTYQEYLKTNDNLIERCFLDFLAKHGVDIMDDTDDEGKEIESNKDDCLRLLKLAHQNDQIKQNGNEVNTSAQISPEKTKLLNKCLLWIISAYAQDAAESFDLWIDAVSEEVFWLKEEEPMFIEEFQNSGDLLKGIDFEKPLEICKERDRTQFNGILATNSQEKGQDFDSQNQIEDKKTKNNSELGFGPEYAKVLYLCAMILKYHGDEQVKDLDGNVDASLHQGQGNDAVGSSGQPTQQNKSPFFSTLPGLQRDQNAQDQQANEPEKETKGVRSDANISIDQLTPNREIQEDIVAFGKTLGIFLLLPIIEIPQIVQEFSFTAAQAQEMPDNFDKQEEEELGFVLDDHSKQASELQDTAEYNKFLQNDSLSPSQDTDIANNSALFNYLEKQYQDPEMNARSPDLSRLQHDRLVSSIVDNSPMQLTLQQKIAQKKQNIRQRSEVFSMGSPTSFKEQDHDEPIRILKTVNEFDSTDLPQIQILNNSVILNDLEPLKGDDAVGDNQQAIGSKARTDTLADILKKLNPKLQRVPPRKSLLPIRPLDPKKDLCWMRADIFDGLVMPGRSKSQGDLPSGAYISADHSRIDGQKTARFGAAQGCSWKKKSQDDFFGIENKKQEKKVRRRINEAYVAFCADLGVFYQLDAVDRHNFAFGRNAKTEVEESEGSSRFSNQDISGLEKSNINDLWYKYIFNDNSALFGIGGTGLNDDNPNQSQLSEENVNENSILSNQSNFTINSNIAKFQSSSGEQRRAIYQKLELKFPSKYSNSQQSLSSSLECISLANIARSLSLVQPIISIKTLKLNLFHLPAFNSDQFREADLSEMQLAKYLYLKDMLSECLDHCNKLRQDYLKHRQTGNRKEKRKIMSKDIAIVYLIILQTILEQLLRDHENSEVSEQRKKELTREAHSLFDEIPIVVKNKQQESFTVLEVLHGYQEQRALSKMKSMDYISYKLFRQLRSLIDQTALPADEDDDQNPEQYCRTVQAQFQKVIEGTYVQKIEFFLFGALSAYKNGHYQEAWCFVSQAPIMVVTANQSPQDEQDHVLIYLEIFKMIEIKLLTKLAQPEQAIIQAHEHFFTVSALPLISHNWCLLYSLKFQLKLALFKISHFKNKKMSMDNRQWFNQDNIMGASFEEDFGLIQYQVQKAENDFWNIMGHLSQFSQHEDYFAFRKLALKMLAEAEKSHEIAHKLFQIKGKWLQSDNQEDKEEQISQIAHQNSNLFDEFFKGLFQGHSIEVKQNEKENDEDLFSIVHDKTNDQPERILQNQKQLSGQLNNNGMNDQMKNQASQMKQNNPLIQLTLQNQGHFYNILSILSQSLVRCYTQIKEQFINHQQKKISKPNLRVEQFYKENLWTRTGPLDELFNILVILLNSVPILVYRDTAQSHCVQQNLIGEIIHKNAKYDDFQNNVNSGRPSIDLMDLATSINPINQKNQLQHTSVKNELLDQNLVKPIQVEVEVQPKKQEPPAVKTQPEQSKQVSSSPFTSTFSLLQKKQNNETENGSSQWQYEGGGYEDYSKNYSDDTSSLNAHSHETKNLVDRIQQQTDNRDNAMFKATKIRSYQQVATRHKSPISGQSGRQHAGFMAMKAEYFNQKQPKNNDLSVQGRNSVDVKQFQMFRRGKFARSKSNINNIRQNKDLLRQSGFEQRNSYNQQKVPGPLYTKVSRVDSRTGMYSRGMSPLVARIQQQNLNNSKNQTHVYRSREQQDPPEQQEYFKPSFGSLVFQQNLQNQRKNAQIDTSADQQTTNLNLNMQNLYRNNWNAPNTEAEQLQRMNTDENLEDNLRDLLALQDVTSNNYAKSDDDLASDWLENLSIQMLLDGEEEQKHHDNICHSVYNPGTLLNIGIACLLTDSNLKICIKILTILQEQIKRLKGASNPARAISQQTATDSDDQISNLLNLLLSFSYLRLHTSVIAVENSTKQTNPFQITNPITQNISTKKTTEENTTDLNPIISADASNKQESEDTQKLLDNPQYLIHQSTAHFKNFNADLTMPGQPYLFVWIFMFTQKQLISQHQAIQKRFRKQVVLGEVAEAAAMAPQIVIEQSQFEAFCLEKGEEGGVDEGVGEVPVRGEGEKED